MTKSQTFLWVGVLAALVLGLVGFFKVAPSAVFTAGSTTGPESSSDYMCNVGFCRYFRHTQILTATSTLCSVVSPNATTTLKSFTANLTRSASYATSYEIGWDTTAFSTTTALNNANLAVPANGMAVFLASTTATGLANDDIIPPKTYINLKLSTTTAGASATFAPAGVCNAIFEAVN